MSRGGIDDGDKVNRVIFALAALIASCTTLNAQTSAPQPTPWGNFDWSQVASPRAMLPQQGFTPPPTVPAAVPEPAAKPSPPRSASRHIAPEPHRTQAGSAAPAVAPEGEAARAAPVPQAERPLAILLDGLGVYVAQDYIGVSALARLLQRQGYRTIVDNHFMRKARGQVPAIIIGHSMGGQSALALAREVVQAGYPPPDVITIDAAPLPSPCAVPRCVNIFSPGFPHVVGAQNISAWDHGAYLVNHAMLASNPAIQRMVLQYSASLIAERNAQQAAARRAAGN